MASPWDNTDGMSSLQSRFVQMESPPSGLPVDVEREILAELTEILAPQGIVIDWKSYYDKFDVMHGGTPVPYLGKLLWSDGWTYAMDYGGPEWPPPSNPKELLTCKIHYWSFLRAQKANEVKRFRDDLANLKQTQLRKSAPLQRVHSTIVTNAEGSHSRRLEYRDINFDELDDLMLRLEKELLEIDIKLKELNPIGADNGTSETFS